MGSSKKKHKKHKDKDREHHHHHREKKSRDSSRHASAGDVSVGAQGTAAVPVTYVVGNGGGGGGGGGSTPGSAQPSSSDHQLKQVPLRIVLKVPPSCYSPQNVSSSTVQVSPIPTLTISNAQLLPPAQHQQLDRSQTVYPEQSAPPPPPKPIVVYSTVPPLNATSGPASLSTPHLEGNPMAQPITTTTTSTSSSSKKAKKSKKSKKSKHRKHSHHHHHSSSSSHRHHRKHHHQSSTCSQHSSAASPSSSSITSTVKYPSIAPIQGTEWTMQTNPDTTGSATSCPTVNQQQPYVATSTLPNYSGDLASAQVDDDEMFDDSPEHPLPTSTSHNKRTSMDHSSPTFAHQPESHNNNNSNWQSDFGRNGSVASGKSVPMSTDQPSHQFGSEIKLKLSKSSNSGQFSSNLSHSPRPPPRSPAAAFTGGHHLQPPISITNALPSLTKLSLPEPGLPTSTFPTSTTGHMPSSLLSPRIVSPAPPVSAFSTATFNLSTGKSHKSSSKKKNKGEKNLQMLFEHLLKQVTRRDAEKFFAFPVSDAIAPGYSSIISNPMDLSTIKRKMCEYRTLGDFKADVKLMCDNAMKYNRAETIYYKAANKLWLYTKSKLFKKDALLDYAKSYPKCTPLELSLNPSGPPAASKSVTNSTNTSTSAGLTSFSGIMSSDLINSPFAGSTFSSQKSSLAFEPSSSSSNASVSAFPTGLASSTKPFNLSEPSPNVVFQQQNHQLVPNPKPISSVMPFAKNKPVEQPEVTKKDICCDGMTAEELIESITASARAAKQKLARERPNVVYSYLQQTSESNKSVTVNTIVYNDNKNKDNNTNTNTNKELSDSASELSREVISKPFSFESIYKPSSRINLNLFSKIRQQVSNDLDNQNKNKNKVEVKQEMDDHMNSFPNRHQQENQKENGHDSAASSSKFDSKESLASLLAQCDEEELNHHNQKSSSHHQQQQHQHHHHQQQHSNRMNHQQNRNADPVKAELIDCYGGEEFGLEYALSISKFARNSEYSMNLVTSLLGVLTSGGHKNVSDKLTTLLDTMPD